MEQWYSGFNGVLKYKQRAVLSMSIHFAQMLLASRARFILRTMTLLCAIIICALFQYGYIGAEGLRGDPITGRYMVVVGDDCLKFDAKLHSNGYARICYSGIVAYGYIRLTNSNQWQRTYEMRGAFISDTGKSESSLLLISTPVCLTDDVPVGKWSLYYINPDSGATLGASLSVESDGHAWLVEGEFNPALPLSDNMRRKVHVFEWKTVNNTLRLTEG